MKKLALLFALLFATPVHANVPCSVPFNLQNATVADATQVMANYNAIIACLGNAAAAGANNDITSLTALVTPIQPAQGGSTVYVGGTSTGTNTQIVASTTPSPFALVAGRQVVFFPSSGNTGPTTLNVGSTGAINLFRRTQFGISAMVGGELVTGSPAVAVYDGTEFVLINNGPYIVGEIRSYAGATAPPGWAFIDGSCQLRSTFADLFSLIGTNYDPGSVCDTAHFALPDGRGRTMVGLDNMGGSAASRVTNAGSGCNGAALGGAGCGAQNVIIAQAQLPNIAPAFTGTAPAKGTVDDKQVLTRTNTGVLADSLSGVSNNFWWQVGLGGYTVSLPTPAGTVASINGNVTQVPLPNLPPLQIVTMIIKL